MGNGARRILVVDDDADIRYVLSVVLEEDGYQVVTATDGADALAAVAQAPPDLILLDLVMPVMDGWQFAAAYRRTPPPLAPILVYSAHRLDERDLEEIAPAGVLEKPCDLDTLLAAVARYARRPE
ncbi:MAG: response regulator [Chloroflexota bacterium]